MSDLGLTPAEYSRGPRRSPGGLTKTGNRHARRALVEGAWASHSPATVSRHLQLPLAQRPNPIQDVSWKAPVRLCKRSRQLMARGTHANHVVVAMARALVAFMWAMARDMTLPAASPPYAACSFTARGSRLQTLIGRGAAPLWDNPRGREAAAQKPPGVDRGRYPTDTRQVVANPRISACATVVSYGLRLFR